MDFDLLAMPALWYRSNYDRTGRCHLRASCGPSQDPPEQALLGDVADPARWCTGCSADVAAMLGAWAGTDTCTPGGAVLVLARIGHPVMQDPARWLLRPLSHGICTEPARATRWVSVVPARTGAWLTRLGQDDAVTARGHRLATFPAPPVRGWAATVAELWDPFSDGPYATPDAAVAAAGVLAR